jgi:hypothetical protein
MKFTNCQLCRKQSKPVYRAHGKAIDLEVCRRCASLAWESGLTIESLDLLSRAKSSSALWADHGHRLAFFTARPRAVMF